MLNTSALEGNQLPGYRFTVGDAALDNEVASVDLLAVAVQSLGLAQSLTHAATAQRSDRDGAAATLFPFLDTTDPVAERQGRRIDVDAAASSSKLYPEGSAASGPAALQAGDIRFEARYGRIRGEIFHGELGQPLVGGLVIARDARTGAVVAETVSGTSRRSVTPDGFFTTFLDAAFHILDGRYELALPPGLYTLEVRAADGLPVRQNNFNLQTLLAPCSTRTTSTPISGAARRIPPWSSSRPSEGWWPSAPGRSFPASTSPPTARWISPASAASTPWASPMPSPAAISRYASRGSSS